MKNNYLKFPKIKYTTSQIIYTILIFIIITGLTLPLIQSRYIHPKIIQLLINHTEDLAIKTANNLKREVFSKDENGEFSLKPNFKEVLDNVKNDYQLYKVKVFSNSGSTLYSSSAEEIGIINNKPYFHQIVAKGNIYSRLDKKNGKSLDGLLVKEDVVEVYIPVMNQQGVFNGAFELYYSITSFKNSLHSLIKQINFLLHSLVLVIILVVSYTIYLFYKKTKAQKNYETKLIKIAETDPLTDLFNRSRLDQELSKSQEFFKRYHRVFSIILIDVDFFKSVNDRYGHLKGDQILSQVASLLKTYTRATDFVGRWGGEEFMIICNETDAHGAFQMSEHIRKQIADYKFPIPDNISACFGIAEVQENQSLDQLLSNADIALYHCKGKW